MRRTLRNLFRVTLTRYGPQPFESKPPVVQISEGTFYRRQPSASPTEEEAHANRPLFPGLSFSVASENVSNQYWAIVGPSNSGKTTFLEILRGQHLCFPPSARSNPYLSTDEVAAKDHRLRYPGFAIQYVGFNNKQRGLSGLGTYMSARYESRREATDFSLLNFLRGEVQLNPAENEGEKVDPVLLQRVMEDLRLQDLADMPVSNLSNGQTRRARIAKSLLGKPELLLLDEPFMGLDPPTTVQLSTLLRKLAESNNPRLFLSLRPQDPVPDWITHILFLGEDLNITLRGPKEEVGQAVIDENLKSRDETKGALEDIPRLHAEFGRSLTEHGVARDPLKYSATQTASYEKAKRQYEKGNRSVAVMERLGIGEQAMPGKFGPARAAAPRFRHEEEMPAGEPVIQMRGVVVKYGDTKILGGWDRTSSDDGTRNGEGLFWTIRRGERWGVFGPNGSGKTTLLSLITSDHPQAYSLPIELFGRSRLPSRGKPGISLFELQRRIGHSSPEIHGFFPRSLSVRATLESAFADTPAARPRLDRAADERIDRCLRWFQGELNPSLGWNPVLKENFLRRTPFERREYLGQSTIPERFREAHDEYWYDFDTEQAVSVEWADDMVFGELPFSAQRIALFLRAIVGKPDIVILDEAFSGMDDFVRNKCMLFLEKGDTMRLTPYTHTRDIAPTGFRPISVPRNEKRGPHFEGLNGEQALVCVSHIKEEVPTGVRHWVFLPEAGSGEPCRMGRADEEPIRGDSKMWAKIWGMEHTGMIFNV